VAGALGVDWAPGSANGASGRGELAFAWSRGRLVLGFGGLFDLGRVATINAGGTQGAIGLDAAAGLRLWLGRATLVLSLGLEARWTWQRLVLSNEARRAAGGLPTVDWRSYGALGPRVAAELLTPIGRHWFVSAQPSFAALTHRQTAATTAWTVDPLLALTIGVGRAF
jgi:hypothetical protein